MAFHAVVFGWRLPTDLSLWRVFQTMYIVYHRYRQEDKQIAGSTCDCLNGGPDSLALGQLLALTQWPAI